MGHPTSWKATDLHLYQWLCTWMLQALLVGGLLGWSLDSSSLVARSNWKDIAWKELFAIASVVNTWCHHWPRKKHLVHCDNQAVVDIWKTGTTDQPQIMALVHVLYFVQHDTTTMS